MAKKKRGGRSGAGSRRGKGPGDRPSCGLCGARGKLRRTSCCDRSVCDDESEYALFSYARNSCSRNHRRYTLCGYHFNEGHEHPDWRTCEECRQGFDKVEFFVWLGTNDYNFEKLEDPPPFEPTRCDDCGAVIDLGEDGYSVRADRYSCATCFPIPD